MVDQGARLKKIPHVGVERFELQPRDRLPSQPVATCPAVSSVCEFSLDRSRRTELHRAELGASRNPAESAALADDAVSARRQDRLAGAPAGRAGRVVGLADRPQRRESRVPFRRKSKHNDTVASIRQRFKVLPANVTRVARLAELIESVPTRPVRVDWEQTTANGLLTPGPNVPEPRGRLRNRREKVVEPVDHLQNPDLGERFNGVRFCVGASRGPRVPQRIYSARAAAAGPDRRKRGLSRRFLRDDNHGFGVALDAKRYTGGIEEHSTFDPESCTTQDATKVLQGNLHSNNE